MRRGHKHTQQKRQVFTGIISLLIVVTALVAGVLGLKSIQQFFSRATYEPANIVVQTDQVLGEQERPWRNLAQGGEDANWRMTELRGPVSELHPEYIRLDHIYDFYDVVSGTPGNLQFNFSKLDLVLDDIAAVGAKPYIALSYMPPGLTADGNITSPPIRYEDWQLMVQKTIEHISGTRQTNGVYYEVWNEPDLFGGWKYYGDRNYLTLYGYASAGAQNARRVLPFKLGGPANTALYKNWFDALATASIQNDWRFDFFSWHRYSRDIDVYRADMAQAQTWAATYPELKNLEFHITEWGHDSEVDAGYDGTYSAAHTVAGSIEMVGIVHRAFLFEIQDGKDPAGAEYWGRWGLFTHDSFGAKAKPRYRALQLLDSVGTEQLRLLGKGSFVKALATGDPASGEIQIIMSNFDPAARNSEVVPVSLTALPEGSYTVQKTHLNRSPQQEVVASSAGTVTFMVDMRVNDVVLITVQKQE